MFDSSDYWSEPDQLLSYVVTMLVNAMDMEFDVTIMLRGLVISGTLVSEGKYLKQASNALAGQFDLSSSKIPVDAREALKEMFNLTNMTEFDVRDYIEIGKAKADADSAAPPDDDPSSTTDPEFDNDDLDDEDFEALIDNMPPPLQYLHLRDPMIVAGEPPIRFANGSEIALRLRLASIDGWMLGRLFPVMDDDILGLDDDDDVRH